MEGNILSLENEMNEKNPHLKTFFNRSDLNCKVDINEMKNREHLAKNKNSTTIDVSKNIEPQSAGTFSSLPLLNGSLSIT
jgi:hypothetical protein